MIRDYQCIAAGGSPPSFEAKIGQPNQWTIRPLDELLHEVREKLKAETKK